MIDAGDSEVIQESPRESLFKDCYFVSGRDIGSGSGITKRFKDQALFLFYQHIKANKGCAKAKINRNNLKVINLECNFFQVMA